MGIALKRKKKVYLFCPGPVNVALNVKTAAIEDMCHREKEFSQVMSELNENTLSLFEIKKRSEYYPVFLTGSSTSANESVLSSIGQNKNTLVISNGEFGERLYRISKVHNKNTFLLNFDWAEEIDLAKVEKAIRKYKAEIVAMVHHETCTGVLNPVKEIGQLTKKYKSLFFVDAVSSIGADELEVEDSNITFCTTASGKAIGSFPGVSIVLGKISEFEKLEKVKPNTTYLHLYNFYHYSRDLLQTPNTPNVPGFLALNQAIKNIIEEGVDMRRRKVAAYAKLIKRELLKLGLKPLLTGKKTSNLLSTFYKPDELTIAEIQAKLREKRIIIYGGKGPLLNKVFQVSNIGDIDFEDINFLFEAFEEILASGQNTRFSKISPRNVDNESDRDR